MPFTRVDTHTVSTPDRLVMAVFGAEKTGKSTLSLTFPEPLYLYDFDGGWKPLVAGIAGKELHVASYALPEELIVSEYITMLRQFQQDWRDGVASAGAHGGTVIIDTGTQLWELIGQGLTGEVRDERKQANASRSDGRTARDSQLDWRKANVFMEAVLRRPLTVAGMDRCNAVYIQRLKELYEGNQPTGRFGMAAYKHTGAIVELLLHLEANKDGVMGRIDFARAGLGFMGLQIPNPTHEKLISALS